MNAVSPPLMGLYQLKPSAIWRTFKAEPFAFWMSCTYLFFEYVRPQALFPILQVYPFWARTFVLLALIAWMLDPGRRVVWTRFSMGIVAFLGVIIVSSAAAYWPGRSWDHFMDYFNWVVIFLVLTNTVTTRSRFYILLLVFLLASFKLSQFGARIWILSGFSFSSWGVRGPEGYFQNPGELGIQMVIFAPIALFFVLGIRQHLERWQVWLLALMPITAVLTLLMTNTRGSQIAFAVQLLALILASKHRFKALIGVALVAALAFALLPDEQKQRFEAMGEDTTSLQRLLYWEHGWEMIKDHPILGVGYFNFQPYYDLHHSDDLISRAAAELPHNIFIQVGTDTGFVGLTIFVALILGVFFQMRAVGRRADARQDVFLSAMSKGMNLALLGYVVAGQFVTVAYYPFLWIHLAFCVIIATVQRLEAQSREQHMPGRLVSYSFSRP